MGQPPGLLTVIVPGRRVPAWRQSLRAAIGRVRALAIGKTVGGAGVSSLSATPATAAASTPVIADTSPASGSAGSCTLVTISGGGFGATKGSGSVTFYYHGTDHIVAPVSSWSDTQIVCTIPTGTIDGYPAAAGSGPVVVTNSSGLPSPGHDFTVTFAYSGVRWSTPPVTIRFNANTADLTGEEASFDPAVATWNKPALFNFVDGGPCTTNTPPTSIDFYNDVFWAASGIPSGTLAVTHHRTLLGIVIEADLVPVETKEVVDRHQRPYVVAFWCRQVITASIIAAPWVCATRDATRRAPGDGQVEPECQPSRIRILSGLNPLSQPLSALDRGARMARGRTAVTADRERGCSRRGDRKVEEMAVVSRMEIHCVDHGSSLRWTESASACHLTTTVLRVVDSDGAEGVAGYDSYTPAPSDRSVLEALRSLSPALIGREATAREALARDLRVAVVFPFSTAPLSMMDVALWDLAARRAGLPLCRLLDAGARARIPAYASLTTMSATEDYLATVAHAKGDGLTAVKVHAWGEPERDIELLERLRAEHPDLTFMHDAEGVYDRRGALRVARALESLSFRWFEAPLPDFDLEGYHDLRRRVDIPILPAGYAMWDPLQIADALRDPPWSAVRSEVSSTLGITALCQIAALARSFGVDFEPVSYGHTLCQAANLHVMLAFDNVSYFELPYPFEPWEYGVLDPIRPAADGAVAAPHGPGLGVDLDWEWIDGHAFAKASLSR